MSVGFKTELTSGLPALRPPWGKQRFRLTQMRAHWGVLDPCRQGFLCVSPLLQHGNPITSKWTSGPTLGTGPIGAGRGSRGPAEHGAEGADALVAEVEGDLCHRFAAAQPAHRLQDARLLAPGAERETCFTLA